jgi:hypothetical protein
MLEQEVRPQRFAERSPASMHEVGGYTASFHLPDGSRLDITVADAVAFSCGGGTGGTRLEVLDPDGGVLARGNLASLLRKAGLF